MKIICVRHGITFFNEIHLTQGWCDSPLTDDGVLETKKLAKKLLNYDIDKAFSSPIGRARETMGILLEHRNIAYCEDKRLKEIYFGVFEGTPITIREKMNIESKNWLQDQKMDYRSYKGEDICSVIKRHSDFFDSIMNDEQCKNVLIVGHGCSLMAWLCQYVPDVYNQVQFMDNSSAVVLDYSHGKLSFVEYIQP